MRFLLLLGIMFTAGSCQKTIHEARGSVPVTAIVQR
jgi:hypothetical protein